MSAPLAACLTAAAVLTPFGAATTACRYPATAVIVSLATDVPADRVLTVRATVREGTALVGDGGALGFARDAGALGGAGGIGSFGVVPGDGPRDGRVTLLIEAEVSAGAGDPPRVWRRIARFRFTPRLTTRLSIFLPLACSEHATGCRTVAPEACTVSAYCEEQMLTCGDLARCVDQTSPTDLDGGAAFPDAGPATLDARPDAAPPSDAPDAPVGDDAPDAGPVDAGPLPAAPRPIAPLSTSRASSQHPRFAWRLPPGVDGAWIELCRTRACGTPSGGEAFTGTSGVLTTALDPGVWYWRLRGRAGGRTGSDTSVTWMLTVPRRDTPTHGHWGTVTDVNGDGYADVVGGAFGAHSVAGAVSVHLGGPTGPSVSNAQIAGLLGAGGRFGVSLASAGDVNGDGYGDVIVGEPADSTGTPGTAYVFHGSASGLVTRPATTLASPDRDPVAHFGAAVGAAGDLNEDGYADVVVGAPNALSRTGRAWVFYGSPAGVVTAGAVQFDGTATNAAFGLSVGSGGDLNNDGHADLLISAAYDNDLYVYYGTGAGPGMRTTIRPPTYTSYGAALGGPGDVNGDGITDLVVGGPDFTPTSHVGQAYVHLGSAAGVSATPTTTLSGSGSGNAYFGTALAAVDIDGDGYDDVVVGAPGESAARAYRGGPGGVSTSMAAAVSTMATSDELGRALVRGDYDGDGIDDVAVGADGYAGFNGAVLVYAGGAGAPSAARSVVLLAPAACCSGGQLGYDVASLLRAPAPQAGARRWWRGG